MTPVSNSALVSFVMGLVVLFLGRSEDFLVKSELLFALVEFEDDFFEVELSFWSWDLRVGPESVRGSKLVTLAVLVLFLDESEKRSAALVSFLNKPLMLVVLMSLVWFLGETEAGLTIFVRFLVVLRLVFFLITTDSS